MRIYIALILTLFLSACGGGSDNDSAFATTAQLPPNEATTIAAMKAQIATLQGQVSRFNELTLIGKPTATASAQGISPDTFRTMGEMTQQAAAVSFGPCANMGVLIGFENGTGQPANANTAVAQDFRQCNGYQYGANIVDGTLTTSERLFYSGPGCTGTLLLWESGNAAYNTTALKNGVVFASPVDGTILMVQAGQTATPTQYQSVWVRENPGCQTDVETQPVYLVTPNDVNVSGVPSGGVGPYQLGAP